MTNINATTPQLKVVKGFYDACLTLDLKNISPLLSKNFTSQSFPKIPELPDETEGGYIERYGLLASLMKKAEFDIREIIEAPGKVVVECTGVAYSSDGPVFEYDSLLIFTLVEEDGELKIVNVKDFSNPEKRGKIHSWAAKTLASRTHAA